MKNFLSKFYLVLLLLTLVILPTASAQLKVEIDEEVKVFDLGEWRDGFVVDKKKGEYLVEYQFTGSRRDVFKRKQIRKLYEYEGLDFGRMWASSTGSFKVEASIFQLDGDDKVVLLKPDFNKITVPLAKLSKKDVTYVERFKKRLEAEVKKGIRPDVIPSLPEIESFGSGFGARGLAFNDSKNISELKLSAIPKYLKEFKQSGMGYQLIRREQKLISIVPVGGPEQLVLMSFRERNPFTKGARFQSQLYWVSLKKRKVVNFVSITHEDYALDYNPQYKLLLTYNRKEEFIGENDEPDNYTIWKLQPGGKKAEPLIRFAAKGMNWAQTLFGKVVNDRVVVVKTDRSTYEAFDIKEKKPVYSLNTESFFDAPVVITHDRKHLIVPEGWVCWNCQCGYWSI